MITEETLPELERLTLIGYWAGPDTVGEWPTASDFVDASWDEDDRSFIAGYLRGGHVTWRFMGWSQCRFCGEKNGDSELTDGTFTWPDGLAHYVETHGVRLPEEFVTHAYERQLRLERAERDAAWWRSTGSGRSTDRSP